MGQLLNPHYSIHMLRSVFAFVTIILLFISLREIMFHIEHSPQPSSLALFSSNQLRKECDYASSQPVFLKDFGAFEKNRNRDRKR